ncbi:MAG: phosphoribosyl-AMP cyclohydrolase [Planctomycetota bacterium]|jgi:phosphoribosyl-AMP cyclohydrolase|nr:phosphoribosyl-AMP cyclohydrolase [Planctomycetota bacterium]
MRIDGYLPQAGEGMMDLAFLDELKFDQNGLIPCVAQDAETGEVLMVAYMNRESLKDTAEKKLASYWSRSRKKFWVKGETSGHTQEVRDIRFDCDLDCVLIKVKQNGGAACHTGMRSCFYRRLTDSGLVEDGEKVFDSEKVYGK